MKLEKISWGTYLSDIACLIEEVKHIPDIANCKYIYGVPRGGCIPAVMISHALSIPYIPYIDVTQIELFIDVDSSEWILAVDDIFDSGRTYSEFSAFMGCFGLKFKFATIYTFQDRLNDWVDGNFIFGRKVNDSDWLLLPYENASKVEQDFAEYIASRQ